jgi:hypothetical protein
MPIQAARLQLLQPTRHREVLWGSLSLRFPCHSRCVLDFCFAESFFYEPPLFLFRFALYSFHVPSGVHHFNFCVSQNALGDGGLYSIWAGVLVFLELTTALVMYRGAQWRAQSAAKATARKTKKDAAVATAAIMESQ